MVLLNKKNTVLIFVGIAIIVTIRCAFFENAVVMSDFKSKRAIGGLSKAPILMKSLLSSLGYYTQNYTWIQPEEESLDNQRYSNDVMMEGNTLPLPVPPVKEPGLLLIDRRIAEQVSKKVRVLCWIPSREIFRETRLRAVNSTWTKRCDKVIYIISSPKLVTHDTIAVDIPDSRKTLNDKTVFAHRHIYEHYLDKFDWFLKADDDTYVIMENLKFLLSHFDLNTPGYIGCQLKPYSPEGYMNGGAGYAFNSLGVKTIVEQGYNIPGRCRFQGGAEDIENGHCANKAGVRTFNQLDMNGKQTFMSSSVVENVMGPLPPWTFTAPRAHVELGLNCCSPLVVSFHHADVNLMFIMEYLLYRVVVHGRKEIPAEASRMFSGKEAPHIPRDMPRRPYPGEDLDDYYRLGWREKNTTFFTGGKKWKEKTRKYLRKRRP